MRSIFWPNPFFLPPLPFTILIALIGQSGVHASVISEPETVLVDTDAPNTPLRLPKVEDYGVPSDDNQRPIHEIEVGKPRDIFKSYSRHSKSVENELLALTAAITLTRFKDVTKGGSKFFHKNEGWFGKNTKSLGMDKLHHAWKTYLFTDVMQHIMTKRVGDRGGAIVTSAVLGIGIMSYAEILDGFTAKTGFSKEDMAVHMAGTGISVLRSAFPPLRDTLDFRMEIKPQSFVRDLSLVEQLSERKYLLAAKLAGIKAFKRSPLRFVELQVGYYARGFSERERLINAPLKRKIFVGLTLNVRQLFPDRPKSSAGRLARASLDYIQLPYISIRN